MGIDLLHVLSRRCAVHGDAGRGEPGQARRRDACADSTDRRDDGAGARAQGGGIAMVRPGDGAIKSAGAHCGLSSRSCAPWKIAIIATSSAASFIPYTMT